MSLIQLPLTKEETAPAIAFDLNKAQRYVVELYWQTKHDMDSHAVALVAGKGANGKGAYQAHDDILSTYNTSLVKVADPTKKHVSGSEGAFRAVNGGLIHHGDARTGLGSSEQAPDETIEVVLANLPSDRTEVAFFITSHPPKSATFGEVQGAKLVIRDDQGVALLEANLTSDFGEFMMIKMGSIVKNESTGAWEFSPVAVGYNGTFNDILGAHAPR